MNELDQSILTVILEDPDHDQILGALTAAPDPSLAIENILYDWLCLTPRPEPLQQVLLTHLHTTIHWSLIAASLLGTGGAQE